MKMSIPDDKDLMTLALRYLRYIAYTCMYYRKELENPGDYRRKTEGRRRECGLIHSCPIDDPMDPDFQCLPWEQTVEFPGSYDLAYYFKDSGLWSRFPEGVYRGWPYVNLEEMLEEEDGDGEESNGERDS